MADIYKYSFGSFLHNKPKKVIIRIDSAWMLGYLQEAFIHPTAKMVQIKGKPHLTMSVGMDEELTGWINSWSGKLKLISPK